MLNKDTMVNVTNRSNSLVGYYIPELNIKRRFSVGETKRISAEEIRALSWTKGGKVLISDHLIVENEELINELLYNIQPEYYYTADDVVDLLLNGSEDQLLDALDFGGEGVKGLIKDKAVDLKLNDVRKREIIQEKTGFNVSGAIDANRQSEIVVTEPKVRRAAPITEGFQETTPVEPQRRTAAPKYKVTTKTVSE